MLSMTTTLWLWRIAPPHDQVKKMMIILEDHLTRMMMMPQVMQMMMLPHAHLMMKMMAVDGP